MTVKLAAALDLAKRGFSVFPLVPNSKQPLIANWQNLATTSESSIRQWWSAEPDANIGVTTGALLVIDVDPRHNGHDTFAELALIEDFPKTARSRTQGGGDHIIYRLPEHTFVRGGNDKLGPGVDVKSYGGYIAAPGSTIDGRPYRWSNERPPAVAPAWLIARCKAAKARNGAAGKRIVEEDDTALDLAWNWLTTHAPEADAGSRDNTAFKVAARLYDFGVSPDTCRGLLEDWNNAKCMPPLEPHELDRLAASASKNRENAIGAAHPEAPGFEAVEIDESRKPTSLTGEVAPSPTAGLAIPFTKFEVTSLPPRPWVVPEFACRERVTLLAGPGGVAKSTWTLMLAIAVATGRSDICGFPVIRPEPVWVWNQEDDREEMQRRLLAVMNAFNVTWDDFGDRLFINSGVDKPLMLGRRTLENTIVAGKDVGAVAAEVKSRGVALMVLDPLVEFHEASENDNVQMRAVVGQVRRIAVEGHCACLVAAHTRKPPQAASDGFAGEMDAARGASSQLGVVRIGATIFSMSPKQAKEWRFEGSHLDYVRIDIAKNNLAPPRGQPIWFRRRGVMVGGESVGVLVPVTLESRKREDVDLVSVLAEAMAAGEKYDKWHTANSIIKTMANEKQKLFGSTRNRARDIKDAFGGATEMLTEKGKICLSVKDSDATYLLLKRLDS